MIIGIGTKMKVVGVDDGFVRITGIFIGCGSDQKWSTSVDLEINRVGYPSSITQVPANELTRGINKGVYVVFDAHA